MLYLVIYLTIINVVSFLLMLIDKKKSIKRKRRIKELTFLILAVVGGSLGTLAAMDIFRHKTRHRRFTVGVPLILLAQVTIIFVFYYFM